MIEPLPNKGEVIIKPAFIERYRKLLGRDYDEWMKYSLSYQNRGIRVNTLKITVEELRERLSQNYSLKQVPWCREGFWIEKTSEKRYDLGNTLEHDLGYYYIQDPSSMIPAMVLDPQPGEIVLDMCASPGSKASQIGMYMKNQGILIANEVQGQRIKPLGMNMQRCGLTNSIITMMPGERFKYLKMKFDRIIVDAPCSGTGTIRKSLKNLLMWSPNMVRKFAGIQKGLLNSAFLSLQSRGVLVYSTCTHEPEENEGVVSWLLEKNPDAKLESFNLDINSSPALTEWDGIKYDKEVEKCLRFYTHQNDSEGFFVARIRKD